MQNKTIKHKKIPSKDPRLGRNILHDERSKKFAFNTADITITNTKHTRTIPILNQGQIGSCTGNAGIGDIATEPVVKNLPLKIKYPLNEDGAVALYQDAQVIDGVAPYPANDGGSYGLSIAKALKNAGLISSYQHTFTLEDALKAGTKYPFITGIKWYNKMYTPDSDGRVHISGALKGGHEIQMDEIDADNGRVWFCNSWGEEWGVRGRFYLTWEDFGKLLADSGDVTIMFPADVVAPTPVYKTVKLGSKNDLVKELQVYLNEIMRSNLLEDGDFGRKTQLAVFAFQSQFGLVKDGVVGPKTWEFILSLINNPRLTITRGTSGKKETVGLFVARSGNNTLIGKTLELPWLNNKKNVSCIPKGIYDAKVAYMESLDGYYYKLINVLDRTEIYIHIGNYYSDIKGCIILGANLSDINKDGEPDVTSSTVTVNAFMALCDGKPIKVIIQ